MIAFFLALHYWIRGLDSNSVDWIEPCYSSEKKRKERRDEAKLWLQRCAQRLKLGMITIWIPGCNIFIFNQPFSVFHRNHLVFAIWCNRATGLWIPGKVIMLRQEDIRCFLNTIAKVDCSRQCFIWKIQRILLDILPSNKITQLNKHERVFGR